MARHASCWRARDGTLRTSTRCRPVNDLSISSCQPLANHPAIAPHVRYTSRVASVGRKDFDKVRTKGRDQQPFEIRLESGEVIEARAVIDASGTWQHPNPAASGGVPVPGEREHADRIAYGIPDVVGRDRSRYAGKRVLVVGSGHSAFNVILDLLTLSEQAPGTAIVWAMRRDNLDTVWGGGARTRSKRAGSWGSAPNAPSNPDASAFSLRFAFDRLPGRVRP